MLGFLKQSALAVAAWNVSSVWTILQGGVLYVLKPDWFLSFMDWTGRNVLTVWDWLKSLGHTLIEFGQL